MERYATHSTSAAASRLSQVSRLSLVSLSLSKVSIFSSMLPRKNTTVGASIFSFLGGLPNHGQDPRGDEPAHQLHARRLGQRQVPHCHFLRVLALSEQRLQRGAALQVVAVQVAFD